MFNTLGDAVSGSRALDLFAGSGALAIEALSRGAKHAVLVEKNFSAVQAVRLNLEKTAFGDSARIVQADFRAALARLAREGEVFDLIFIDPPYESEILRPVATALSENRVVSNDSTIVVEHFRKTSPPEAISEIPLHSTRNYGQTSLSYFSHGA